MDIAEDIHCLGGRFDELCQQVEVLSRLRRTVNPLIQKDTKDTISNIDPAVSLKSMSWGFLEAFEGYGVLDGINVPIIRVYGT